MSWRPSWSSSSLTLSAAVWLSVIMGLLAERRPRKYTHRPAFDGPLSPSNRDLQVGHPPSGDPQQLSWGQRKHGVRSPGGRPHLVVCQEVAVDENAKRGGVAEGRR